MPGSPSSSPMIAKMKSLCGSESRPHFSRLAPEPEAEPAAVGEGVAAVDRLACGTELVGVATQPDVEPAEPVGARDDEREDHRDERHAGEGEPAQRDPGGEQHPGDDRPEDQHGAEVVAEHDDADAHGGDRHEVGHDARG